MPQVKTKMVDGVLVLHPKGMYTGGDETDGLKIAIEKAFEDGARKMVVNLHDVTYLNSTAIGVFLEAKKGLEHHQGRFVLSNVQDRIHAIFLETKLILVFETYETEPEAIASFKAWKAAGPREVTNGV